MSEDALDPRVADRNARYPLRIHPFIQQRSKLVGGGAATPANQGWSGAVSADGKHCAKWRP
jgi:hypothetical protein